MNQKTRDIDWTNSEKWGYVGGKRSQKKYRHITKKDEFVRIAREEGFEDTITYKEIKILIEKHPELSMPGWLINFRNKDGVNPYFISHENRQKGRYRLPTFDAVSEVMDVYLAIDDLPLEHLMKLPKRQHEVVLLRYGINDGRVRTFNEVAKMMGLSQQWVWKLNQLALLKLEEYSGTKLSINITERSREKY